jgi:hypothetical protein
MESHIASACAIASLSLAAWMTVLVLRPLQQLRQLGDVRFVAIASRDLRGPNPWHNPRTTPSQPLATWPTVEIFLAHFSAGAIQYCHDFWR